MSGIDFGEGNRFRDIRIEGPVAGRDVNISLEDAVYDVRGRPNPYPGLASFTYDQAEQFGGRESDVYRAVELLTAPGDERVLLPIVGASGSGKSSFAQAGVVPALESHYAELNQTVRWASLRPGQHPMASLVRAIARLGLVESTNPNIAPIVNTPEGFTYLVKSQTSAQRVNVLVFDQLEELFTQSDPAERNSVLALLQNLPEFAAIKTHIILTVRSDFLPALFDVGPLFRVIREQSIELRAMTPDALARAIRRPFEAQNSQLRSEKAWQPELLSRLAADTSAAPGLLPLLQVTLGAIWETGRLTLDRYGTLTDALQAKAEAVYAVRDQTVRPERERERLMEILLDLVEVSLDDDVARDVRRTTPKLELVGPQPERSRLIEELIQARLLSAWTEVHGTEEVELIDIIHETLLTNWGRLRDAIAARREVLQQRERFRLAVREWIAHDRSDAYLLEGVRLAEATALAQLQDIALRAVDGRDLLESSQQRQVRQRRRAERRRLGLALAAGVVLSVATVVFAVQGQQLGAYNAQLNDANAQLGQTNQQLEQANTQLASTLSQAEQAKNQAEQQLRIANSRHLAAAAISRVTDQLDLALLLSAAAYRLAPTADARASLLTVLRSEPELMGFQYGDQTRIESLAFSPDGRLLASGSIGGKIILSDATTFQPLGPALKEPDGAYTFSLEFSPDNRLLASGSKVGVTIWDVARRQPIAQPFADVLFPPWGISVAFSPDGRLLAIGEGDHDARLWDVQAGRWLGGPLSVHTQSVNAVAFSPDGRLLATASGDKTIVLWDVATQRAVTGPAGGHTSDIGVQRVAFTADGKRLISTDDQVIMMWDVSTGQMIGSQIRVPGSQHGLVLNPGGRWFATAGADGVQVWDLPSGQLVRTLMGHTGGASALAISPDGSRLVTGAEFGVIGIWDVSGQRQVLANPLSYPEPSALAFSPDGRRLVARNDLYGLTIWDVASRRAAEPLPHVFDGMPAFSPDGTRLTAYDSQNIGVWDLERGTQLVRPPSVPVSPDTPPAQMAVYLSSDDRILAVKNDYTQSTPGNLLSVFDARTGKLVGQPKELPVDNTSASFAFSDDGQLLAAGDTWGQVRVWALPTGTERAILKACENQDNCFLAWRSLAISHDNKMLATGGAAPGAHGLSEYEIGLWDMTSGQLVGALKSTAEIESVAFSPDGTLLASGDWGGALTIWDLPTQQRLGQLRVSKQGVRPLVWSPDGRTLAAGSHEGGIILWDMSIDDWLDQACQEAGRQLTQAEWQQAVGNSAPFDPVCPGLPVPLRVPSPTP